MFLLMNERLYDNIAALKNLIVAIPLFYWAAIE